MNIVNNQCGYISESAMPDTREKFLSIATTQFAERGFYGTSIAHISEELGLSKQALLHHFGSKERLYAEVLKQISDGLIQDLQTAADAVDDSGERVEQTFSAIFRAALQNREATQVLVRELLDNKKRAETAKAWYLSPFLELLLDLIQSDQRASHLSRTAALVIVYQMLGAIHYFLISGPTLTQMFGEKTYASLEQNYEAEIKTLITARLAFVPK